MLLFLFLLFALSWAQEFFTTVPSRLIKGRYYEIPLRFPTSGSSGAYSISLLGSSGSAVLSNSGNLDPASIWGRASLTVPQDLPDGSYTVLIQSGGAAANASVLVSGSSSVILVETDKPLYQPGQNVSVVVVVVDYDLKPVQMDLQLEISDPTQFKIARLPLATDAYGMATAEFVLAPQTPLGNWTISISEVSATPSAFALAYFNVSEYTLPLFDVKVASATGRVVRETDKVVRGAVEARYTYGKGVNGKASLKLMIQDQFIFWRGGDVMPIPADDGLDGRFAPPSGPSGPTSNVLATATVYVKNGTASFELALGESFANSWVNEVIVEAVVEEEATGASEKGSVVIPVAYSKTELTLIGDVSAVRPGLGLTLILSCKASDEKGPTKCADTQYVLTTSVNFINNSYNYSEQNITTQDGMAIIKVEVPANVSSIYYSVSGHDSYAYFSPDIAYSPSNSFLYLSSDNSGTTQQQAAYRVGDTLDVTVSLYLNESLVTASTTDVVCEVVARGQVIPSSVSSYSLSSSQGHIPLTISQEMVPEATLLCWTILSDGEVIADHLPLAVQVQLPLSINTTFALPDTTPSSEELTVEPGKIVRVIAQASEQARLSLTAVDQSVYLLADSTRLNPELVFAALQNNLIDPDDIYFYSWGKKAAYNSFKKAGVLPITTATVPQAPMPVWDFFDAGLENEAAPPMMDDVAMRGGAENRALSPTKAAPAPDQVALTKVRDYFPERWMFTQFTTDENGYAELEWTVPDSITSWNLHTVGVSQAGLGLAESSIKVLKPFFINIDLPYSVVRGETTTLTVAVYNYFSNDISALIQIDNSPYYTVNAAVTNTTFASESLEIESGSVQAARFDIKPQQLGQIPIKVWACTKETDVCDVVERPLLVLPEGINTQYTVNYLLDLSNGSKQFDFLLALPTDTVSESASAFFTVTGDLMGQAMSNLDRLIQLPTGCGEQTMINFAPCVFVNQYLQATGQNNVQVEQKALKMMAIGYQRELTYRHKDGSFSAFGDSDPEGSMWLTAFVIKCFAQAQPYLFIDKSVLTTSGEFIAKKQSMDGSFPQTGQVIHTDLYGGLSGGFANTLYVLIALLEAQIEQSSAAKALQYVESEVTGWTTHKYPSVYSLALASYALAKANSSQAERVLNILSSAGISDDQGLHWAEPSDSKKPQDKASWCLSCFSCCPQSNGAQVEITAYALLAYLQRGWIADSVNIARWLVGQRNSFGGYYSTQDTIMALQALSVYTALTRSEKTNISISLSATNFNETISLTNDNFDLLQSVEVSPALGKTLTLTATGAGKAATQVAVKYNVKSDDAPPAFKMTVEYAKLNGDEKLRTRVCLAYLPVNSDVTNVTMVVAEVGLFTGYAADPTSIKTLLTDPQIKKIEQKDRSIVIYFDYLSTKTQCWNIDIMKVHDVKSLQPTTSIVYSYYDPNKRTTIMVGFDQSRSASAGASNSKLRLGLGLGLGLGLSIIALGLLFAYMRRASHHAILPDDGTKSGPIPHTADSSLTS